MKKLTLILLTCLTILSCKESSDDKTTLMIEGSSASVSVKNDTALFAITYAFDISHNDIRNSVAKVLVVDSLKQDPKNPERNIKQKDTLVWVPLEYKLIDSLKRPLLDSSGKQMVHLDWPQINKGRVIEFTKKLN